MRYRTLHALPNVTCVTERYMRYRTLQALQNVTERYRTLQSVTERYRALQNVTERYRTFQSVTERYIRNRGVIFTFLYGKGVKPYFTSFTFSKIAQKHQKIDFQYLGLQKNQYLKKVKE
jgi:hypothetical protein